MLVSEVSSVEEWKERQIKSGRWQSMTPEQQSSSIRHQKEEHIAPEEIGTMSASVTGAEGPVRGDAQPGGGSEGPGRTARLYQRVR